MPHSHLKLKHRKREPSDERTERQHKKQATNHRKSQNRHHHHHNDRRLEDFPLNRPIKQEPLDDYEEQRVSRQYHDDERIRAHRRRKRAGADRFGRLPSDSETTTSADTAKNIKTEKEKPNFETSGRLADDTNTFRGVVVKYNEPPEARRPKKRWILFPFKGDESLPKLPIYRQSAYLLGRDRIVADIPTDHPSCSKQHAALQFRLVPFTREDGTEGRCVRPYIIDLESANGTYVNNKQIESRCYVELREKDVFKFGYSSREYVLLHDKSDTSELLNEDDGVG